MPASIGVNLRVTGHCRQGGRKYMEDFFSVAYQQTEDERDLEYAFFGIYDGHGGADAAAFAKEHLMDQIVRQRHFWSENDEDVLRAIKDGYFATHYAMWRAQAKWPKTSSGLPSTAGTTASIAFIRHGKIYIGHVGDSGIVLGYQENDSSAWLYKSLTREHKPENPMENERIHRCGGKVVSKSGVPRVVWNRPKLGHQGPIRRSTPIDEIPFLAVARSLGDLWSYNSQLDKFVVSPSPDCNVIPIDTNTFRCLIFGTDGLFNMISPQFAVHIVQRAEKHNENLLLGNDPQAMWINPSKCLVEKALERWSTTKIRADNTSVITLLLDPPGPPRAQVVQNRKRKDYPVSGLEIVTRFGSCPKRTCSINSEDKNIQVDIEHSPKEALKDTLSKSLTYDIEPCFPNEVGTSTDFDDHTFKPKVRESTSYDVRSTTDVDENVQINEVSSSSCENDEQPLKRKLSRNLKTVNVSHRLRPVLRSRNTTAVALTLRKPKVGTSFDAIQQTRSKTKKLPVNNWLRNIIKNKSLIKQDVKLLRTKAEIPKKETAVRTRGRPPGSKNRVFILRKKIRSSQVGR